MDTQRTRNQHSLRHAISNWRARQRDAFERRRLNDHLNRLPAYIRDDIGIGKSSFSIFDE